MKLVAEQIKYLRERKEELLRRKKAFAHYLSNNREKDSLEGIGTIYTDFQGNDEYRRNLHEINKIESLLANSEIIVNRDLDKIGVGTAFYAQFVGEDEKERITLVEGGLPTYTGYDFVSLDSDFGKAVFGKKDGDTVVYTVSATGRQIGVSIDAIDRMSEKYTHFIREKETSSRMTKTVKDELASLKVHNPEEYQERHAVSYSQIELANEELQREKNLSSSRKSFLQRIVSSKPASFPNDGSIGVGSRVVVLLQDETGATVQKSFEFINRAVSTELEDHYVERISTLGNALFGLKKDDTFMVRRSHKPSLKGIVVSVDNEYLNEAKRVR